MRTPPTATPQDRFTAARYLQALTYGGGDPQNALAWASGQGHWTDQRQVVGAIRMAAQGAVTTADFGGAYAPIADSFLAAMRGDSVPLRLTGLRRAPPLTRLFINTGGVVASQIIEGASIPAVRGTWEAITLTPKKFAGIVVQTNELMRSTSPVAAAAITDDLARATAEAENRAFCDPTEPGSVLNNQPSFTGTGAGVADVDADLLQVVGLVPGAFRPGAAWLMDQTSATFLSVLRGSGGAAAHPNVSPQGGFLLGMPVLITSSMQQLGSPSTRFIGLVAPSEIFFADEGKVLLTASTAAAIEQTDVPTGDAAAGTAGTTSFVSMFQAESVATKAVRESSWYARPGAGAYFVAGF